MIPSLIAPPLLRSVRDEIQEHLSFTEKETDIYKIFQSGDLANLDGLDDASLSRLPSLLQLRDALYSPQFRKYLGEITGSGELSGRKTDMAINVYTPGCHLLCHDDVIGSRRVSYILYLTDPDTFWQAEWGGALRLFPTKTVKDDKGEDVKIPSPDFSLSIPPAFNQLAFFAVQPGESFHDVEEVYHPKDNENTEKGRVRMAISGWYHIPQEGEDGYEEGLEEKLAEKSSLAQLQGRGDIYDRPQPHVVAYENPELSTEAAQDKGKADPKGKGKQVAQKEEDTEAELTEADLDFLLKFMSASYLTPDTTEELSENYGENYSLSLERFLSEKFSSRVRAYIEEQEREGEKALPKSATEIEQKTDWKVARPPHKQRYLYQQITNADNEEAPKPETKTPIQELFQDLFPSTPFKKWLSLCTGVSKMISHNLLARRFRRGEDYTLASGYDGEEPRLEFTLGLTPTLGWEKEEDGDDDVTMEGTEAEKSENGKTKGSNGKSKETEADDGPSFGGYEVYMAGDDDDDNDGDEDDEAGGGASKDKKAKSKSDPAIYKAAKSGGADGEEDDGILFSTTAAWNRMSIVLRDQGTLKFVKYISRSAPGDRWDVTGEIEVEFDDDDDDDDDEE